MFGRLLRQGTSGLVNPGRSQLFADLSLATANVMTTQLPLSFDLRPAVGRDDFIVSPCNETAVKWIDAWQTWPNGLLVLSGPAGSGKSHLANVFAALSDAELLAFEELDDRLVEKAVGSARSLVVEAADGPGDAAKLFHLVNATRQSGGHLLITARTPPSRWGLGLADLKTRLTAAAQAVIEAPDDAVLNSVMLKLFSDRQILVGPEVVTYALTRAPRSFAAIKSLVELTDKHALAAKRPVTVPLMRGILAELGPSGLERLGLDEPH